MKSNEIVILDSIKKINIRNIPLFKCYLRELFKDLSNRELKPNQGITKINFLHFFNLQIFIGEKLFQSFSKKRTKALKYDNFLEGMLNLYSGDITETSKIIFNLYDFNLIGAVTREDVKLLLSCIPNEYLSCSSESQNARINNIIDKTFKNQEKLSYECFLLTISSVNSDIFIIALSYLYQKIPFTNDNISQFQFWTDCNNLAGGAAVDIENEKNLECDENVYVNIKKVNQIQEFNKNRREKNNSFESHINSGKIKIDDVKLHYEDYVYKTSETGQMIKCWLVLIGKEIYYYKSSNRQKLKVIHNLSGSFIEKNESEYFENKKFYCFSIEFTSKKKYFYTLQKEANEKWIHYLKLSLNYRSIIDHYEILEEIGNDNFGKIKKGIDRKTYKNVAIKILKKSNNFMTELAYSEIDVMKRCNHRNIVKYIDHFETAKLIFIVMEQLPGISLSEYLKKQENISEKNAAKIIYQIAIGVNYLQSIGVIHRDLKPSNIILCNENDILLVKIIDFGLSKIVGKGESLCDFSGSLLFSSPEVINKIPYNNKIDIWSIGIILFYMLRKQFPFADQNDSHEHIVNAIKQGNIDFTNLFWNTKSNDVICIISCCLDKDQFSRMSIEQFLGHKWFEKFK